MTVSLIVSSHLPHARLHVTREHEMRRDDETNTERRTEAEERAYHLRRIVNSYPATISPRNAQLLRKILGLDDEDTEE